MEQLTEVWSATPTPFTKTMQIDKVAARRLVDHHLRLGVQGLFLAGTCGEGAWMRDADRRELVRTVAERAAGRLTVAVQVTDNSAARILDNMRAAREDGADIAVIAPPYYLLNATPDNVAELYLEAIRKSPLPVGIYDRGNLGAVPVPDSALKRIYAEPKVVLIKDSSVDPRRMEIALRAREGRRDLRLLTGYEFGCVEYLAAGYDGLLLGGGIFNGRLARMIAEAAEQGEVDLAEQLQERMNRLMWDVYGGKEIKCWLAGLKHLLVRMGVFRTTECYLRYPLTAACQRSIERALQREKEVLLP